MAPSALKDRIQRPSVQMEWATDVDADNGRTFIWNYIWNQGKDRVGPVSWPKGGITTTVWNPIPPGEAFCSRRYVLAASAQPDPDAPITYGTNEQQEPAAAFMPLPFAPTTAGIERVQLQPNAVVGAQVGVNLSWTIEGKEGAPSTPTNVDITSIRTTGGINVFVYFPRNVIIGITGLSEGLSKEGVEAVIASTKAQSIKTTVASLESYAGAKAAAMVEEAFSSPDAKSRAQGRLVFFEGGGKGIFTVQALAAVQQSAELVVLDSDRRPLMVGQTDLLVPKGNP